MRSRAGRFTAALAACALTLTACGGGDEDGGSVAEGGTQATGDPVNIGLFNPSKGAATQPGVTTGKDAAVDYINNEAGGIDGRPIEIVDCGLDQTVPESTVTCANQFVEAGVVAAIDGYNGESAAALPILESAGIPMVGQIPFNLQTGASPENRVYFGPPPAAFLVGFMQQLKATGKDSLTLANGDLASAHQVFDQLLTPLGAQLEIDVRSTYYPPAGPNFAQLASTLADGDPAAVGLMTSSNDNNCIKLAESLRSVNYDGTIFLAACTEYVDALGEQAVGAQNYSPMWLEPAIDQAPAAAAENLETAMRFINAQDGTKGFYALGTFATLVDFATILNDAGVTDLTPENILTALKGATAYQSFIGPELDCSKATSPNCTTEMLLFEVVEPGRTEAQTGGFITPLPEVLKNIPGAL